MEIISMNRNNALRIGHLRKEVSRITDQQNIPGGPFCSPAFLICTQLHTSDPLGKPSQAYPQWPKKRYYSIDVGNSNLLHEGFNSCDSNLNMTN